MNVRLTTISVVKNSQLPQLIAVVISYFLMAIKACHRKMHGSSCCGVTNSILPPLSVATIGTTGYPRDVVVKCNHPLVGKSCWALCALK